MREQPTERQIAEWLAQLYETQFAGKARGRYRISMKHMRMLTGRRRVHSDAIDRIAEELFELGFVLVDLEAFFVGLAQRPFRIFRRGSDISLAAVMASEPTA